MSTTTINFACEVSPSDTVTISASPSGHIVFRPLAYGGPANPCRLPDPVLLTTSEAADFATLLITAPRSPQRISTTRLRVRAEKVRRGPGVSLTVDTEANPGHSVGCWLLTRPQAEELATRLFALVAEVTAKDPGLVQAEGILARFRRAYSTPIWDEFGPVPARAWGNVTGRRTNPTPVYQEVPKPSPTPRLVQNFDGLRPGAPITLSFEQGKTEVLLDRQEAHRLLGLLSAALFPWDTDAQVAASLRHHWAKAVEAGGRLTAAGYSITIPDRQGNPLTADVSRPGIASRPLSITRTKTETL